jgi:gamma-glutamyltranspeptidase/glutathione hydrolase
MTPQPHTPSERSRITSRRRRRAAQGDAGLSRRELLAGVGRVTGGALVAGAAGSLPGPHIAGVLSGGSIGSTANRSVLPAIAAQATDPEPGAHVQAVVSSHELATNAGLEMLSAGGTAADAAIAVAGALTVVEPWFSSALGGGTWALYYDAEAEQVTSLDGVGPIGSNATRDDYASRAAANGMHQAIVPGSWDGWMLWLERYGRLDLGQVLGPAVSLAREGCSVSASMERWLGIEAEFIAGYPDSARTYISQGALPTAGETMRQEEIADTFEALIEAYDDGAARSRSDGIQAARDYFYRGPLAEAIVAVSNREGGYLTLEDFQSFEAEIVDALSIDYGDGITVYGDPPNSQGITMLLALNILKGYDFSGVDQDDPDAVHLQVEVVKLAFAARHWYVGDPDRIDVPVEQLLSEEHAARRRDRINMNQALRWPIAGGLEDRRDPTHTTTFHVVDRFGNGAAVTTSLGAQFLLIGDTGIHINNRMRMTSVEPGNANELTPGAKVRHTSCPYLALRLGRPYLLGGNTGVDTQPQGQMQQVINVVEFGLSAQEAIDAPRFVSTAFPAGDQPWDVGNQLQMEEGFSEELLQALVERGHEIVVGEGIFGSANMIVVSEDGTDAEVGAESRSETAFGVTVPAAA